MGGLKTNPYITQGSQGILGGAEMWADLDRQRQFAEQNALNAEEGLTDFDPMGDVRLTSEGGKPSYAGMAGKYTQLNEFDPNEQIKAYESQLVDTKGMVGKTALGMAGKGAATGAMIGAFGGPLSPLTSTLGAGIGALVGGVAGFFKGKKTKKQIDEANSGAIADYSQDAREAKMKAQTRFQEMQGTYNKSLSQYDATSDQQATQAALQRERRLKYYNRQRY